MGDFFDQNPIGVDVDYYIPAKARDLYRKLSQDVGVARLGALADVGIGYVTGANGYFHLSPDEARIWDIAGTRFTASDWETGLSRGESGFLVQVNPDDEVSPGLGKYLEHGRRLGVHNGYKCRMRKPWYCVPHVHRPDALLSYMSGSAPRMVANDANAVAPNSLHVVRLHERTPLNVIGSRLSGKRV